MKKMKPGRGSERAGGRGSRSLLWPGGPRPRLRGPVAGSPPGGRAGGSGGKTRARGLGAEPGVSAEVPRGCRRGVAENSGLSRGNEGRRLVNTDWEREEVDRTPRAARRVSCTPR